MINKKKTNLYGMSILSWKVQKAMHAVHEWRAPWLDKIPTEAKLSAHKIEMSYTRYLTSSYAMLSIE
jgi:hypothetical protein